jgi:LysM repeat protein
MRKSTRFALLLLIIIGFVIPSFGADSIKAIRKNGGTFLLYEVKPKETLYSLSKRFQIKIHDIYSLNPHLNDQILGDKDLLMIPFTSEVVTHEKEANKVAIYYEVQSKETLFKIAKRYFNQPVSVVKRMNNISNNNIKPGQKLLMGYLPLNSKVSSEIEVNAGQEESNIPNTLDKPIPGNNPEIDTESPELDPVIGEILKKENTPKKTVSIEAKGKAMALKNLGDSQTLLVMHRDADKNSVIEISNPLNNKKVYAQVVENMPKGIYPEEIICIVSPAIGKLLGVLDSEFYVKVRYLATPK